MHKKIVSFSVGEQEALASTAPVVIALTEDGKLYVRRLTTFPTQWTDYSVTEENIKPAAEPEGPERS